LSLSYLPGTSANCSLDQIASTENENIENKEGIVINQEPVVTSHSPGSANNIPTTAEQTLLYDKGNICRCEIATSHAQFKSPNGQLGTDDNQFQNGQEVVHGESDATREVQEI